MNPLTSVITISNQLLAPQGAQLPLVIWGGFSVFHKVHAIWRGIRWFQLGRNPENWPTMLICWQANQLIESNMITRLGIRLVYLCKIIHDLSKQHFIVFDRYRSLVDAVKGTYGPESHWKQLLEKDTEVTRINMTLGQWSDRMSSHLAFRAKQISWCFYDVFKELYKLSMQYLDAYELLSFDPHAGSLALAELVIERERYIQELTSNRAVLLENLEDNKPTISLLLKKMGAKYSADEFIGKIRTVTGVVQGVGTGLRVAGTVVEEIYRPILPSNGTIRPLDFGQVFYNILFGEDFILERIIKAAGGNPGGKKKVERYPGWKVSEKIIILAEEALYKTRGDKIPSVIRVPGEVIKLLKPILPQLG